MTKLEELARKFADSELGEFAMILIQMALMLILAAIVWRYLS